MNNYCQHLDFKLDAQVVKTEGGELVSVIKIRCRYCSMPFRFKGAAIAPGGVSAQLHIEPLYKLEIVKKGVE
jgi:hypothetical protein